MTDTGATMPAEGPSFVHTLRIRLGECDIQGVVFNAHYLTYIDDAIDVWFSTAFEGADYQKEFDVMLKKIELEWFAPARHGDILELALWISRWGNSSFDMAVDATVNGERIITAKAIYVSVTPGEHVPCPVPGFVREALSKPLPNPTAVVSS